MKLSFPPLLKKIIKTITIVSISLILLIVSLIFVLIGTDRGFHFLMDTASEMTSGALTFSKITGNLLGELTISDFAYSDDALQLNLDQFQFNWHPKSLLQRNLMIETIKADGVKFKQLQAAIEPEEEEISDSQEAIELPDISLPVNIYLKQIQISDVDFVSAPDAEALHIDKVQLSADMIESEVKLHQFALKMPEVQAALNGSIELLQDYPLSLQSDISLTLPDQPELTLDGSIQGNLEQLTLDQQLKGLIDASIKVQASQLLSQLVWKADIVIDKFELAPFMPPPSANDTSGSDTSGSNKAINESIAAQINLTGDLQQADAIIKAQVLAAAKPIAEDDETLSRSQSQQAEINLDAHISFADQQFETTTQLKNLHWPLSGEADFSADSGTIVLAGTPDAYTLSIELAHSGLLLPEGQWQANANGGLSQIDITSLHGSLLNGTVDISSTVGWGDEINWQAKVQTKNIDPGQFQAAWPGSLDIDIQSNGQLVNEKLSAKLILNNISGQLRQKPLSGTGEFEIIDQDISIKSFHLSSADAKLAANGKLGEKLDLSWSLAVSKLSDILPEAQGSINGRGTISGTIEQPVLAADLKLAQIHYDTIKLKQADLQCTLHRDPLISSDLALTAHSLELDAQLIETIQLTFNGPLQDHHIKFSVDHQLAKVSLQASGQFNEEQLSWDGVVSQLLIDSKDYGQWKQKKPTTIFGSAEKAAVSPLCLQEQNTSLCTQVDWTPEKGDAKLTIENLSFERAKPFLPEDISQLTGGLDVAANIDLAPQLLAHIKADIKPGELTFTQVGTEPMTLAHKNGLIEADYTAQKLTAKWNIELGPHGIDGNIDIDRKALETDPMTAAMNGKLKVDIKDLAIVSAVVPAINDIDGHILANLKLGGTPGEPRIDGKAEVIADILNIDEAGLNIKNLNINVVGKNRGQDLAIDGSLQSGDGQLELKGLVSLDKEQGFPVQFAAQGENFLAIDIPDAYAIISPDIQFTQKDGLMTIKGKVVIPEATIEPSTIPEGSVGKSDDVVVLGVEKEQPANMDLDITIELGDKVRLNAFGLNTDLTGGLTVKQVPKQLMTANGELHLENGTFRAFGQDLTIDQGIIFYAGGYLDNPGINLSALRSVSGTEVGIKVTGSAKKPEIKPFSDDPTLREKDIVSMMLTGQKTDNLKEASVYAGTNINEKLSVGVNAGMGDEATEFVTRYKLTDNIELEGTSSSEKSGGGIFYTFELE